MKTVEQIKSIIGETYFDIQNNCGSLEISTRQNGDTCDSKASPYDISEARKLMSKLSASNIPCQLRVIDEWVEVIIK
jgi:hypothetical protein